ncbi:MAG: four helix bundle protein [Flavobacteriales bacterium]|nr:four helix bundle protein [Flavobacteriales bacterium]
MSGIRTFEDLDCWKAGREVRRFVSILVKKFPKEEIFQLTAQIKNASRSITHNIAEGYGRYHYLDNAKFCSNSRGSLFEVLDQLITAHDDEYISDEDLEKGRKLFDAALRPLNGYIKYLQSASVKNSNENTVGEPPIEYSLNSPSDTSNSITNNE